LTNYKFKPNYAMEMQRMVVNRSAIGGVFE